MSVAVGVQVQYSPNIMKRETVAIGVLAVRVLRENPYRVSYRIQASPVNEDIIFHGHDGNITTINTFDSIGPSGMYEDSGYLECYKGPVWLISGIASNVIVEEVTISPGARGRRGFNG